MSANRLLFFVASSLLVSACSADLSRHAPGMSVDEKQGRFFVDGVALDHHREVMIEGEAFKRLLMTSHTGLVDVVAVPGDRFELVVDLYAQYEGDGQVEVVNGALMAGGNQGPAVINGIRGRVPDSIDLTVLNGTGDVVLTSFRGSDIDLIVDAGTGAVNLVDCNVSTIAIDSGTGDVHVQNSKAQAFRLDSATAGLMADACEFVRFQGESGTGDFRFRGSRMHWARFTSATGDVVLAGTIATEVAATLGTGRIFEREMPVAQADQQPQQPQQPTPQERLEEWRRQQEAAEQERARDELRSPIQPRQPGEGGDSADASDADTEEAGEGGQDDAGSADAETES